MYRIIYLSSAVDAVDDIELEKILVKSETYNSTNNISGILLHIDGDFIQVLEGEKENVSLIFDKIKTDKRHKGLITVYEGEFAKRQFENWSICYKSNNFKDIDKIEGLKEFDKTNLFNSNDRIALTFLSVFLKSHKNHINYL